MAFVNADLARGCGLACCWALVGCAAARPADLPVSTSGPTPAVDGSAPTSSRWLFDGASLADWAPTRFGGEGPVEILDGRLILEAGSPLTGVTWRGEPLPRCDYELEFDAARESGVDFFCGLTFPVGEQFASLILGGWGGATTGISSLDGQDAARNETTRYVTYELDRRYRVRLRVEAGRVRAWLDDEPLVDVVVAGRELSVRPEVQRSCPLGIAAFATRASIGTVRITTW